MKKKLTNNMQIYYKWD